MEEQFYLVWPWLVRFGGTRTLRWVSCAIIPISFGAIYYLSITGHEPNSSIWENSFVEFLFFATGALTALAVGATRPKIPAPLRIFLFALGGLLLLSAEHIGRLKVAKLYPPAWKVCLGYGLVDAACLIIFLSLLGCSSRVLPKPAIYLGRISYGLYVFHDLCFRISEKMVPTHIAWMYIIALALTICLAIPSYHFFEKPFLRLKSRFEYVRTRTA